VAAKVDALFEAPSGRPLPGAAVLVAREGKVVFSKGYRLADVEHAIPIQPDTRFNIASITKPFTALAILKLREEKKLSLDDPLAHYLPGTPNASRVTLRQLLSHTSGLPDFVSFDQAMSGPLDFAPGDRLNYTNLGYTALGRVIEKASGQSYEDYLRRVILAPLGMASTTVDHGSSGGRALGYRFGDDARFVAVEPVDRTPDPAAGGLVSTVEDLFKLDQALYGDSLLPRTAIDEAFTPVRLADGHKGGYGYGWMVGRFRGLSEIGHGGDIDGFNGYLARYPGERFTVIVLANYPMASAADFPTAADLAHRVAAIYLADRLEAQKAGVAVDPAVLATYAGDYQIEGPPPLVAAMGEVLTISAEGARLMGRDRSGRAAELQAESETVFASTGAPVTLTFVRGADGRVDGLVVTLAGLREFRAHRVR
jgi:CubicO group peptidase (beta-lactamase class C family)